MPNLIVIRSVERQGRAGSGNVGHICRIFSQAAGIRIVKTASGDQPGCPVPSRDRCRMEVAASFYGCAQQPGTPKHPNGSNGSFSELSRTLRGNTDLIATQAAAGRLVQ